MASNEGVIFQVIGPVVAIDFEAQRNHSTAYTQQLFKRGQELTTNSTDERIKKQSQNSQEFSNYANQLLGKLKR